MFYALDDTHVLALYQEGLRHALEDGGWTRDEGSRPTRCARVCEDHAEAVFRVEGMDCSDEVAILERRLKPLAGRGDAGGRRGVAAPARRLRRRTAGDGGDGGCGRLTRACACGSSTRAPADAGADGTRRTWLTLASGAALGLGLGSDWAGVAGVPAVAYLAAVAAGVAAPARRAVAAVRTRSLDINVLMVLAVIGALAIGEWAEAASVVFLFAVSQWLEARTLQRARHAIRALLDLAPREAVVRRGGHDARVPVEAVALGETCWCVQATACRSTGS